MASISEDISRITITQEVRNDGKDLDGIDRSLDANDLVIHRRLGEGSKPLFSREDIRVNQVFDGEPAVVRRNLSSASTARNSAMEYRPSTANSRIHNKPKSNATSQKRQEIPYFINPQREMERLRAKQMQSLQKSSSLRRESSRERISMVRSNRSERRTNSRSCSRTSYETLRSQSRNDRQKSISSNSSLSHDEKHKRRSKSNNRSHHEYTLSKIEAHVNGEFKGELTLKLSYVHGSDKHRRRSASQERNREKY